MKNKAAVELGRLGGLKGGKARAKKLSPERRSEIATKAACARWNRLFDDVPQDLIEKQKLIKEKAEKFNSEQNPERSVATEDKSGNKS